MRIRSVKPAYWTDAKLHNTPGISAAVREFYIGTWGLADDAGWLRWDVSEIGGELYRFRSVKTRERDVADWGQRLAGIGRLIIAECGHAYVPKLTTHQKVGGTKTDAVWKEHQGCAPVHVQTNMDESISFPTVRVGKVGEGKDREGDLPNLPTDLAKRLRSRAGGT